VRVLGGIKTAERPLARPRQQAVVLAAAGSEPNSDELGFPRSGTSAVSRANRPGWQWGPVRLRPTAVASVAGVGRRRRWAVRAASGSSRGARGEGNGSGRSGPRSDWAGGGGGWPQPDEADWAGLMGQFGQVYLGHCPISHLIIN
jgi:hypothetical protein